VVVQSVDAARKPADQGSLCGDPIARCSVWVVEFDAWSRFVSRLEVRDYHIDDRCEDFQGTRAASCNPYMITGRMDNGG